MAGYSLERDTVYCRIDGERNYQDSLNGRKLCLGEELVLIREYLRRAEHTFTETFGDPGEVPTLHVLRKIVALGVRCLEHYGCPPRNFKDRVARIDSPTATEAAHDPNWAGRMIEKEIEKGEEE